jgi:hypothetical protein
MMYIVFQKDIDFQKLKTVIEKKQIQQWIYLGEDTNWRIRAESVLSEKTTRISIADDLDHQGWNLRQSYIDWIGECSQKNDSLEWWASEIPSKDPYELLFLRICFYAVGRSIIIQGITENTLIICSSSALAQELIAFSNSVKQSVEYIPSWEVGMVNERVLKSFNTFFTRTVKSLPLIPLGRFFSARYAQYLEEHPRYRQKILHNLGIHPPHIENQKTTIFFFTYVSNRNFSPDGTYHDPHFGPLPDLLKERGYTIVFIPRVLPTIPFKDTVLRLMKTGEMFIFPEYFISDTDMKKCKMDAINYFPKFNEETSFAGIPVYHLIKEHHIERQEALTTNLLFDVIISKLANSGNVPYQIMYTCEGQSWESALIWSIRKNMPGTKVVAYDNVTFSKLNLSMFPAHCEFGIKPLPDIIVTNGPLYSDILLEEGYPPALVKVGCALRHSYLWRDRENIQKPKQYPSQIRLLVATAGIHADAVELIKKIAVAFGGDPHYNIKVKCHPLIDVEKIKQDLGNVIVYENISFSFDPISELLYSSEIVFYTYTSVCYEALQFNVPPCCVHLENFFNLDKLDIAPDVRWVATTKEDLQRVVFEISHMSPDQRIMWERKAEHVVKAALSPVGSDCIDNFLT